MVSNIKKSNNIIDKNEKDSFTQFLLESITEYNKYLNNITQAMINLDKKLVKKIFDEHNLEIFKEKLKKDASGSYKDDIYESLAQEIRVNSTINFIISFDKIFLNNKSSLDINSYPEYLEALSPIIAKEISLLTLWYLEEKEAVEKALSAHEYHIDENKYDNFMIIAKERISYSRNDISFNLGGNDEKDKEKKEFFKLKSYYDLNRKLHVQNKSAIKVKI